MDRRTMLKGSATAGALGAGALGAVPLGAVTGGAGERLVVFDRQIAESRHFAMLAARDSERLDLASEHQSGWQTLRGALPKLGVVEGLTGWSDLVAIRSELERRGLRLSSQQPVAAPLSGKAHLFRWSMQAR